MDSENKKASDPCRLVLSLNDKINLKADNKSIALSNFSIYYTCKITK